MQGLASDPVKNRMIQKIPRQWTADILHMHPDLMGPPRIQMQLHKSISVADSKTLIMRYSSLPTLKINLLVITEASILATGAEIVPLSGGIPSVRAR